MKKIILLIFLATALNSCGFVVMNGLSDDYKKLTDEQKEMVASFNPNQPLQKDKIYVINATELKKEVRKYPKTLIYSFANGCSSEFCKPLYVYENWAKEHHYKLFLVMVSYANIEETLSQNCKTQLYVIDSEYYGNGPFGRYVTFFQNELKGLDKKAKENWEGGLFFYENGNYVKTLMDLPAE